MADWSCYSLLPHHVNAEVVMVSVLKAITELNRRDVPRTIARTAVKVGTGSSSLPQAQPLSSHRDKKLIAMQATEGTLKG